MLSVIRSGRDKILFPEPLTHLHQYYWALFLLRLPKIVIVKNKVTHVVHLGLHFAQDCNEKVVPEPKS